MHDKVFKQDEYQLIDIYEVKVKVYYSQTSIIWTFSLVQILSWIFISHDQMCTKVFFKKL